MIDRGWDPPVLDRQGAHRGLDCTGRAEHVAGHRLGRTHRDTRAVRTERPFDRRGLGRVGQHGAGTVRVDVVDVRGGQARLRHRVGHRLGGVAAVLARRGDMKGVVRLAVPADLCVDVRAARRRCGERLHHQNGGPFAEHEPVTVGGERA